MSASFDSSSLIAMKNNYPEDIFKTMWARLDTAMNSRQILISDEVISELAAGTDGLDKRLKTNSAGVVPTTATIEAEVKTIIASHPALVDLKRQKSVGDPYVIAVAKVYKGSVVTQESAKPNKVKIPHVCSHYSIPCSALLGYLRNEKWTF